MLAVRSVSLEITPGEICRDHGAPAAPGKSTMMNIIGCRDRPTEGHYFLDGVDVSHLDRDELAAIRNKKLGFCIPGDSTVVAHLCAGKRRTPDVVYPRPPQRRGAA